MSTKRQVPPCKDSVESTMARLLLDSAAHIRKSPLAVPVSLGIVIIGLVVILTRLKIEVLPFLNYVVALCLLILWCIVLQWTQQESRSVKAIASKVSLSVLLIVSLAFVSSWLFNWPPPLTDVWQARTAPPVSTIKVDVTVNETGVKVPHVDGLNILVFDTLYDDRYLELASRLQALSAAAKIEPQREWIKKHPMEKSRIFIVNRNSLGKAKEILTWMGVDGVLDDYYDQVPESKRKTIYGESMFDSNTMKGLEDRDLVIFVGRDYQRGAI